APAGAFRGGGLVYQVPATAAGCGVVGRGRGDASGLLRGRPLVRLLALAALGAVCAPALLVMGVKRTDAVTTSLLLTLEAPFTMLLARLLFHEHLGRRAVTGAGLILGGALLAVVPSSATAGAAGAGALFVAAAMLLWAL